MLQVAMHEFLQFYCVMHPILCHVHRPCLFIYLYVENSRKTNCCVYYLKVEITYPSPRNEMLNNRHSIPYHNRNQMEK